MTEMMDALEADSLGNGLLSSLQEGGELRVPVLDVAETDKGEAVGELFDINALLVLEVTVGLGVPRSRG